MTDSKHAGAIRIRSAVPADAEGIALTFMESAESHAELDPERYWVPAAEPIVERYRSGAQHGPEAGSEAITLVAEVDGEIVGFLDAHLDRSRDPMHREITYCHIAEVAVRRGQRSRGIGEQLLRAAEEWGQQMGAEFASLEFHAANTRAGSFYQERMGYRVAAHTAIKRLGQ